MFTKLKGSYTLRVDDGDNGWSRGASLLFVTKIHAEDDDTSIEEEAESINLEQNGGSTSVIPDEQTNGDNNSEKNNDLTENQDQEPIKPPRYTKFITERRPSMIPNIKQEDQILKVYEKSEKDNKIIKTAIENNEFLSQILTGKKMDSMINAMYKSEIKAGETIMNLGDPGDKIYVLHKGKLHFKGKNFEFDEQEQKVFGELAILYKAGRQATVKAVTNSEVWVLESRIYQQITQKTNKDEHQERVKFLREVDSLKKIKDSLLRQGADFLESEFFKSDTEIVREGDRGDKFYIIRAGTVTISKSNVGELGQLHKGQSFGELALRGDDVRQATITANSPGVECLTLTKEHFDMYFTDALDNKIDPAELHIKYTELRLQDLQIVGTLGMGKFGRVELVSYKTKKEKQLFALKYMIKSMIVELGLEEYVKNEKELQIPCKSLFIVESYRTFKDPKYVYFLMEVCHGGDLFGLLKRQSNKKFSEKDAKFIAANVAEALSYLHERSIIFRDLKPENVMVDKRGYFKLTDFGFAKKMVDRGKTYTVVGTPEYVAPEVLTEKGHDRGVDCWAFGIIIYELLTGKTPFCASDDTKVMNKILEGNIRYGNEINNKSRNLIEKLLKPLSKDRLGMQKKGWDDIRKHSWYSSFSWDKLQQGKLSSPFKPRSLDPLKNSDRYPLDKEIPPSEYSGWDESF